jgi:hypothetical protein
MRRYLIIISAILLIGGCGGKAEDSQVLLRINNYEITREEFESEYKHSGYSVPDTEESRKRFLDNLIDRKLIIQDAQKKGLDKDKDFLKTIERFWEQSLLKVSLDKKQEDINKSTKVTDREAQDAYNDWVRDGRTDKDYEKAHKDVKRELYRSKGSVQMNEWLIDLRKNADIKINYELFKETK